MSPSLLIMQLLVTSHLKFLFLLLVFRFTSFFSSSECFTHLNETFTPPCLRVVHSHILLVSAMIFHSLWWVFHSGVIERYRWSSWTALKTHKWHPNCAGAPGTVPQSQPLYEHFNLSGVWDPWLPCFFTALLPCVFQTICTITCVMLYELSNSILDNNLPVNILSLVYIMWCVFFWGGGGGVLRRKANTKLLN